MTRKRGLGKGLDALLNASIDRPSRADADAGEPPNDSLAEIDVDQIYRGRFQPRQHIDEDGIEELAASIAAQGVMQPIVLRPRPSGGYEIIAGERRWRATMRAGQHSIPAIVRDVSDEQAMALGLIENLQREDLNPLEEARALGRLRDEFGLTQQEVGEAVGKSRTAVTNLLRLLNLAPEAARLLEQGVIEMGHARALLSLEPPDQENAARQVADKRLSVRQTEAMAKRILTGPVESDESPDPETDSDTRRLETELSDKLGARVTISYKTKGRGAGSGEIVIRYGTMDELDGILRHIRS